MSNVTPQRPPKSRFQFRLFHVFVLMTAIALLLGFSTVLSAAVGFFGGIILYMLPAALVAVAVYSRGEIQAFAIGALVPCLPILLNSEASPPSIDRWFLHCIRLLFAATLCGATTVFVRYWAKVIGRE